MNEKLLDPLEFYEKTGAALHKENAEKFFDELLKKSGVDAEQNRATVKAYNEELAFINTIDKKISKYSTLRVLLIIGIVIGAILAFVSFSMFSNGEVGTGILMLLIGGALIAGAIVLLVKKINPIIKDANAVRDEHQAKANELLAEAEAQMAPLNALFDNTDTFRLIETTIPDFSFDRRFTKKHEELFVNSNDFKDLMHGECSMTNTLAGRFAQNPFLYCRRLVHELGSHTYTGSLTISWTETYYDSDGNLCTETKYETLYASVNKPKPFYSGETYLCYGCQSAPDLAFSRAPQHSERLSEKELAKKIKKGEKALQKQAAKATKRGENFQEMANSEFDVLFGANDRDHEVQFRLMFTPLAQRNLVALVKNKSGYGDDFHFVKDKRYNLIQSEHSQNWNMGTSAKNYYSHDVDQAKLNFINFNTNYFRSVFFDFAPLFAVPTYLEEPVESLEPYETYPANYTYYEHEVMANIIGQEAFVHPDTATEAILKTRLVSKEGEHDLVEVTAYSYATVERIDYIPVYGGDGYYHNVPVPWIEYIPLENSRIMAVAAADYTEKELREILSSDNNLPNGTFYHGLVASVLE